MKTKLFSTQIGVDYYCIRNSNNEFWSNEFGWIELENEQDESPYSIFTTREKEKYHLPVDGRWEKM